MNHRLPPPALLGALAVLAAFPAAAEAIGMRHDVPETRYLALAQNQAPHLPGQVPDFFCVAAIGLERGRSGFEVIGTGVLLAPQWVLTAAHVVLGDAASATDFQEGLAVRFGPAAERPTHARRVVDIDTPLPVPALRALLGNPERFTEEEVIHAEFHDLALLCLDRPVEDIPPALWDDTGVDLLHSPVCIAGYGEAGKGSHPFRRWWQAANLKRAAENVIDRVVTFDPLTRSASGGVLVFDFDNGQESRNSLNGSVPAWTTRFGRGTSERAPCELEGAPFPGDSGGPAFARIGKQWRVVGVAGYGTGYPPDRKRPSISYGDVLVYASVKANAGWIRQVTGKAAGGPAASNAAAPQPAAPAKR